MTHLFEFTMNLKQLAVAYSVLCINQCVTTMENFVQYIERTSRLDRAVNPEDSLGDDLSLDNAWQDGDKFEGDMLLTRQQRMMIIRDVTQGNIRNGAQNRYQRWPDRTVVYFIKRKQFTSEHVHAIERAMRLISRYTCIKFREYIKGYDKNGVVIEGKGNTCFSDVGYHRKGYQLMNLSARHAVGSGCFTTGTILHELLHTLGFFHMHSHPDRDQYVRIHWDNIKPKYRHAFIKYQSADVTDFCVPYDYASIMHYGPTAFSSNGKITVEPLKWPVPKLFGQREFLSKSDVLKINRMYCAHL